MTEAIGKEQDPNDLAVLSIGTGTVVLPLHEPGTPCSPFVQPILKSTFVSDLRKVATAIIDDPPDVATFLAHVMTGCGRGSLHSRVVRLSPLIGPVRKGEQWVGPGSMHPDDFEFLKNLELDAIEPSQVDAIAEYADLWLKDEAPNQPIRMNKDFEAELGTRRFSKAIDSRLI